VLIWNNIEIITLSRVVFAKSHVMKAESHVAIATRPG